MKISLSAIVLASAPVLGFGPNSGLNPLSRHGHSSTLGYAKEVLVSEKPSKIAVHEDFITTTLKDTLGYSENAIRVKYSKWLTRYGKMADDYRYTVFKRNFLTQEEYNRRTGSSFSLNQFGDITETEAKMDVLRKALGYSDESIREVYSNWVSRYEKVSSESRYVTFKINFLTQEEYNRRTGTSYTLNEYGDMTEQEAVVSKLQKAMGISESDIREEYSAWLLKYEKVSNEVRYATFKHNFLQQEEYNRKVGVSFSLNQYGDLTEQEFRMLKAKVATIEPPPKDKAKEAHTHTGQTKIGTKLQRNGANLENGTCDRPMVTKASEADEVRDTKRIKNSVSKYPQETTEETPLDTGNNINQNVSSKIAKGASVSIVEDSSHGVSKKNGEKGTDKVQNLKQVSANNQGSAKELYAEIQGGIPEEKDKDLPSETVDTSIIEQSQNVTHNNAHEKNEEVDEGLYNATFGDESNHVGADVKEKKLAKISDDLEAMDDVNREVLLEAVLTPSVIKTIKKNDNIGINLKKEIEKGVEPSELSAGLGGQHFGRTLGEKDLIKDKNIDIIDEFVGDGDNSFDEDHNNAFIEAFLTLVILQDIKSKEHNFKNASLSHEEDHNNGNDPIDDDCINSMSVNNDATDISLEHLSADADMKNEFIAEMAMAFTSSEQDIHVAGMQAPKKTGHDIEDSNSSQDIKRDLTSETTLFNLTTSEGDDTVSVLDENNSDFEVEEDTVYVLDENTVEDEAEEDRNDEFDVDVPFAALKHEDHDVDEENGSWNTETEATYTDASNQTEKEEMKTDVAGQQQNTALVSEASNFTKVQSVLHRVEIIDMTGSFFKKSLPEQEENIVNEETSSQNPEKVATEPDTTDLIDKQEADPEEAEAENLLKTFETFGTVVDQSDIQKIEAEDHTDIFLEKYTSIENAEERAFEVLKDLNFVKPAPQHFSFSYVDDVPELHLENSRTYLDALHNPELSAMDSSFDMPSYLSDLPSLDSATFTKGKSGSTLGASTAYLDDICDMLEPFMDCEKIEKRRIPIQITSPVEDFVNKKAAQIKSLGDKAFQVLVELCSIGRCERR